MIKTNILRYVAAITASLSMTAHAGDLSITNNTDFDSTSIINNGACSTILGETGITRAGKTNVVPEARVIAGCKLNKINCKAEVHMSNNCSGPAVAIIYLDVASGIKSIQPIENSGYVVTNSDPFTAQIDVG
jgi:hypothetical protein